jgi:hypothetical protein
MRKMREKSLDAIGRAFPHLVAGQVGCRHQHSLQLISTSMSSKIELIREVAAGIFMWARSLVSGGGCAPLRGLDGRSAARQ